MVALVLLVVPAPGSQRQQATLDLWPSQQATRSEDRCPASLCHSRQGAPALQRCSACAITRLCPCCPRYSCSPEFLSPVRRPKPGSTLIGPCTPFPRRPLRCFAPPAPHLPRAYLLMYCSCDCTSGAGLCWSGTKGTGGPPCCRAWRCCSTTSRNLREAGCCGSNSSAFSAVTIALSRGRWTQGTQGVGDGPTHLTLWCFDRTMRRGMAWYAKAAHKG